MNSFGFICLERACAAVCGSAAVQAVRVAVCGSAHDGVRAVRAAVCGSVLGSVWQCALQCAAIRQCSSLQQCAAVCGSVRQCVAVCGSVRQCGVCGPFLVCPCRGGGITSPTFLTYQY